MALKPSPMQVAVVEEAIDAALHSGGYDEFERNELEQFRSDLENHQN